MAFYRILLFSYLYINIKVNFCQDSDWEDYHKLSLGNLSATLFCYILLMIFKKSFVVNNGYK
jgi:hypothetical protein